MASISINWADLAKVAEVSGLFALGIVVVFTVGILALTRRDAARQAAGQDATSSGSRATPSGNPAGVVLAVICFVACLAAAGYGIYLIVPQWGG